MKGRNVLCIRFLAPARILCYVEETWRLFQTRKKEHKAGQNYKWRLTKSKHSICRKTNQNGQRRWRPSTAHRGVPERCWLGKRSDRCKRERVKFSKGIESYDRNIAEWKCLTIQWPCWNMETNPKLFFDREKDNSSQWIITKVKVLDRHQTAFSAHFYITSCNDHDSSCAVTKLNMKETIRHFDNILIQTCKTWSKRRF